ncbi:MAG: hypothetical protein ACR2OZ_02090 [Verrucomicrobiales bacterium]
MFRWLWRGVAFVPGRFRRGRLFVSTVLMSGGRRLPVLVKKARQAADLELGIEEEIPANGDAIAFLQAIE